MYRCGGGGCHGGGGGGGGGCGSGRSRQNSFTEDHSDLFENRVVFTDSLRI